MSGWADAAIAELRAGRPAKVVPRGRSMEPLIESGTEVELSPRLPPRFEDGQVVLVAVGGRTYLHKVLRTMADGSLLIGNNKGGVNGRVTRSAVHGVLVTGFLVPCPTCSGSGAVAGFACGERRAAGPGMLPCRRCRGSAWISRPGKEWKAEGAAQKARRGERGESLADMARRCGMKPSLLSEEELGWSKPKGDRL